jgi:hypothetical protein
MTTREQPDWLKGFKPNKETGNPAWRAGMNSPNPAGRPKGVIDKRSKLSQALRDDGPDIVRVVIDAALNGDMTAASMVLNRIAPPLKATAEKVQFELSSDKSLAVQAEEILKAVSEGQVDPETAKILIGCINSVAGIKAVELLEDRVLKLEGEGL